MKADYHDFPRAYQLLYDFCESALWDLKDEGNPIPLETLETWHLPPNLKTALNEWIAGCQTYEKPRDAPWDTPGQPLFEEGLALAKRLKSFLGADCFLMYSYGKNARILK